MNPGVYLLIMIVYRILLALFFHFVVVQPALQFSLFIVSNWIRKSDFMDENWKQDMDFTIRFFAAYVVIMRVIWVWFSVR